MSNLFSNRSMDINEQINKLKELLDKSINDNEKEEIIGLINNLEKAKEQEDKELMMNKFIDAYVAMDIDFNNKDIEATNDIDLFLEYEEEKKVTSIIGDTMNIDFNNSIVALDKMQLVLLNKQVNHISK